MYVRRHGNLQGNRNWVTGRNPGQEKEQKNARTGFFFYVF
jgi:hypothetical protein